MTTKGISTSKVVPVTLVIAILGFALAINSYITSGTMRQNLESERYKRLHAEQQLQATEGDMAAIRSELTVAQKKLSSIQQIVNQGQEMQSELKQQYDQIVQERDALRAQLEKIQLTTINPKASAMDQGL